LGVLARECVYVNERELVCACLCVCARARVCHTHKTHTHTHTHTQTHTHTHTHTNNEVDMRGQMKEGVDGALLPHYTRISIYPEVERGRAGHREGGGESGGGGERGTQRRTNVGAAASLPRFSHH
jgi:hypothetical protein